MALKLTYFDGRGRAEVARLMLVAAGQKFEDERLSGEQWKGCKEKTRFQGLPNLEYNGEVYGQSQAINRFLAREFGFYGKSNKDAFRIDEVVEVIVDLMAAILAPYFEKDEAKKKESVEKAKEPVKKHLGNLEDIAVKNGKTGFFFGSKLSLPDFMVFAVWDYIKVLFPDFDSEKELFRELKKIMNSVAAVPSIKNYVAARKQTPF